MDRYATASFFGTDSGGSGLLNYDVRYFTRSYRGTPSRYQYPTAWQASALNRVRVSASPGTTDCFSVRARDGVGNLSPWTLPQCSSRVLDDRALSTHGDWRRTRDTRSYLGTQTATTVPGASLTLNSVPAERLAVVATVGPHCGRVAVLVAGRLVGVIRLRAAGIRRRVLFVLPTSTHRAGAITLVARGGPVLVDGVGVARTWPR